MTCIYGNIIVIAGHEYIEIHSYEPIMAELLIYDIYGIIVIGYNQILLHDKWEDMQVYNHCL